MLRTDTVTEGSVINFFRREAISALSCMGVYPAARMSPDERHRNHAVRAYGQGSRKLWLIEHIDLDRVTRSNDVVRVDRAFLCRGNRRRARCRLIGLRWIGTDNRFCAHLLAPELADSPARWSAEERRRVFGLSYDSSDSAHAELGTKQMSRVRRGCSTQFRSWEV